MQSAKEATDLLVRSPPWWSIPHSMRYWLPLGSVTREPSEEGQEVTVDVAEALELVPDEVCELVTDTDVELADVELLVDVEVEVATEELEDAMSLAPKIAGALTAAPTLLFM